MWALNWNIKTSPLKILPTTTLWASHVHANNIKNTPLHITPASTWSLDLASPFLPCCTTIFSTWSLSSGYLSICNSKRVLITITKTLMDEVFVISRIICRAEADNHYRDLDYFGFYKKKKMEIACSPTKRIGVHMNSFKRVRAFQIELEFGSVAFWGERTTGVPGEKCLGARERTNNKLNPQMASTPGVEPGPHWWEASALPSAPPLLPESNGCCITHCWEENNLGIISKMN